MTLWDIFKKRLFSTPLDTAYHIAMLILLYTVGIIICCKIADFLSKKIKFKINQNAETILAIVFLLFVLALGIL